MADVRKDTTWRRLYELLNDVVRQRDSESMLDAFYTHVDEAIPADQGAAMFEMKGGLPHCIRWPAYSDFLIPEFNSRFNRLCPAQYDFTRHILGPVPWEIHTGTEYDLDFNLPLDIGHSVGIGFHDPAQNRELIFCVHRSRGDASFSEEDADILRSFRSVVSRVFSLARWAESGCMEQFSPLETAPGCVPLSAREAEVARLLSHRITMKQIASRLGISPRTVERHALHIYQKLRVSGRRELIQQMAACTQQSSVHGSPAQFVE
jgi:DNA-binding CsgD family transcriptional regulator